MTRVRVGTEHGMSDAVFPRLDLRRGGIDGGWRWCGDVRGLNDKVEYEGEKIRYDGEQGQQRTTHRVFPNFMRSKKRSQRVREI
jgi:hypothetical protein